MFGKIKFSRMAAFILLLAVIAVCFQSNNLSAHAGVSQKTIATDASFKEEIDGRTWEVLGNVNHEYGAIVFDECGTASSQIASSVRANNLGEMGVEDCVYGKVTLKISSLEGEFYVAFGMDQAFLNMRSGSCSAISFSDKDGEVAVNIINVEGNSDTLVKAISNRFAYGENLKLDFTVKANGKLFLSINGITLANYDNAETFDADGYFGFAQSATSNLKITSANVYSGAYDAPENAEVNETFDNGEFDASRLFANNQEAAAGYYKPEGISCKDGVLKFENITSYGFVSTVYEFSNFEMSLDVPHLQREFVYGENGEVIMPASEFIGFAIGAEQKNNSHIAITESVFLYFRNIKYVDGKPTKLTYVLLDRFKVVEDRILSGGDDFWNIDNAYDFYGREKTLKFKISMIDGVFKCAFKWGGENDDKYREIVNHDFGYTPYGYIQIHGQGSGAADIVKNSGLTCSNFHIDNLVIKNKDSVPNVIDPEYVSNLIEKSEDYDYLDGWDYRTKTVKAISVSDNTAENSGCGAEVAPSGAFAIISVIAAYVSLRIIRRKRNEK